MKASLSAKFVAGALSVLALGATTAAHARSDVSFFIGVQTPQVYSIPQPMYVQPRRVYVQPQPVYESTTYLEPEPVYESRVYGQPRPVFVRQTPPVFYSYEQQRAWRIAEWRREQAWHRHHHHHNHQDRYAGDRGDYRY